MSADGDSSCPLPRRAHPGWFPGTGRQDSGPAVCAPGCGEGAAGGMGVQGVPALCCWAHMLRGVDVQQLGDGIVVAALPAPPCPAHAVPPVLRPLPQALPHLLHDLPGQLLLQESWVPAKSGSCWCWPKSNPVRHLGGMWQSGTLSSFPAVPWQSWKLLSQCHYP